VLFREGCRQYFVAEKRKQMFDEEVKEIR